MNMQNMTTDVQFCNVVRVATRILIIGQFSMKVHVSCTVCRMLLSFTVVIWSDMLGGV